VWIKSPKFVCAMDDCIQVMKMIAFLYLNNAPDIALYLLENTSGKFNRYFGLQGTQLLRFIQLLTMKHLYSLKWIPGQSLKKHKNFYENVFDDRYLEVNQYNESSELNPV